MTWVKWVIALISGLAGAIWWIHAYEERQYEIEVEKRLDELMRNSEGTSE